MIVSAMEDSGEVVLRGKDSGIGMDATQLQEALRPYVRVEATARERQGTGLGLPLSKALVEANRAQFTIASEPGQARSPKCVSPPPACWRNKRPWPPQRPCLRRSGGLRPAASRRSRPPA